MSTQVPRSTGAHVLLALVAAAALSGCEQHGGGLAGHDIAADPKYADGGVVQALATSAQAYGRAAPASVRLSNRTGRTLGYNLCRSQLERLDDDGVWRVVTDALADACTAELRTLRPGQSITYGFRIAPVAKPGRYRISTRLEEMTARLHYTGVSNIFRIEGSD